MISLTIQNRKKKTVKTLIFQGKDEAEEKLNAIENDSQYRLIAVSTDTDSEESLVKPYLDRANEKALKEGN